MATHEQEASQRQTLTAILDDLSKVEPESLVRADELGKELSFELGLPIFHRVLGLFKDLRECNLENVPYEALVQITGQADNARTIFKNIKEFKVGSYPSNPTQARDSLITQLRDNWNSYYTNVTPHISYAIRKGTDFDTLEREARGALSLVKGIETDARTECDKALAEMRGALDKVRQAAAEVGVAQHAVYFKDEAELHKNQSLWWMVSAAILAIGTIFYALYSFGYQLHEAAQNASIARLITLAVARIIVISILSTAILFCVRNYSAGRHNFVINRHRQNALSTFETFVKASRDDSTKDAVLLQATRSIFTAQTSGFLKAETEAPATNQIIEIIRNLSTIKH